MKTINDKRPAIMVIGAGISGIRIALDLAETGYHIYLIEKAAAIGGILSQLDHQFPNNHCGMCRLLPMFDRDSGAQLCLRKGLLHENITILTSTEVESVSGNPGQLSVTMIQSPQGVDPERCVVCGECEAVCPVSVSDTFNGGLSQRKAIYLPIPHQFSTTRTIDWQTCTRCQACVNACPHGAIDLENEPETVSVDEIACVVLAPGSRLYDPGMVDQYGFGVLPNVVTATTFERILSSSGPFGGNPIRPSDKTVIKKIAWIQCVGSRNLMIGADYCSSACCMFAVKEAVLAHEKIGNEAETTIFYMDMRTYGRDFQRYRDQAEHDIGVRFVRCRVHSIEPVDESGNLRLSYVDAEGNYMDGIFDMVVLSTGRQPDQKFPDFAHHDGVIVLDSTPDLKDISESIINATAVSGRVMQMVQLSGIEPPPSGHAKKISSLGEIFGERPRVRIVLDNTSKVKSNRIPWERIESDLQNLPGEVTITRIENVRDTSYWEAVQALLLEDHVNRFVLATHHPHACQKGIWGLTGSNTLFPSLVEIAGLDRFTNDKTDPESLAKAISHEIEMAINRLRSRVPQDKGLQSVIAGGLVIGGGPAGLAAAYALAQNDVEVVLVEKSDTLGGNLPSIFTSEIKHRVETLLSNVENHPRISIHKNAEIIGHSGHAGAYASLMRLNSGEERWLKHGIAILATGGHAGETKAYGMGMHQRIVTQFDLEKRVHTADFASKPITSVAMIQCAGCREEPNNYCSRICCLKSLNLALALKESYPEAEIYVFYRDMMTYGQSEAIYTEARKKEIVFIPFDYDQKPAIRIEAGEVVIEGHDPILGTPMRLMPDWVSLAVGVRPNPLGTLARIFKIDTTQDGFVKEADSKWRPVDTGREGIFVAGMARGPLRADEALREGEAAASRAQRVLNKKIVYPQRIAARVRQAICSKCELCIDTCPYHARYIEHEQGRIMVDQLACQGCGACAAICPNSATVLGDFEDNGVMDAIEAAL